MEELSNDFDKFAISKKQDEIEEEIFQKIKKWSAGATYVDKRALVNRITFFLLPPTDFLMKLPSSVALKILKYLEPKSIFVCIVVCKKWFTFIKKSNQLWESLCQINNYHLPEVLKKTKYDTLHNDKVDWKSVYKERTRINKNWRTGLCKPSVFIGHTSNVYCVQHNDGLLVSGSKDKTVKLWNMQDHSLLHTFAGHTGSVLCVQLLKDRIISASSDFTIKVWSLKTYGLVCTLSESCGGHSDAVLNFRATKDRMVSCSKDKTIKMWEPCCNPDQDINDCECIDKYKLTQTFDGHESTVNMVQFDDEVVISASASIDHAIKIWDIKTGKLIRSLDTRGITCICYDGSTLYGGGSSDFSIKSWHPKQGVFIKSWKKRNDLHAELLRCLHLNGDYVVSGSYDKTMKLWDRKTGNCVRTYNTNARVLKVYCDMNMIVSAHDRPEIFAWDFSYKDPEPAVTCNGILEI